MQYVLGKTLHGFFVSREKTGPKLSPPGIFASERGPKIDFTALHKLFPTRRLSVAGSALCLAFKSSNT